MGISLLVAGMIGKLKEFIATIPSEGEVSGMTTAEAMEWVTNIAETLGAAKALCGDDADLCKTLIRALGRFRVMVLNAAYDDR